MLNTFYMIRFITLLLCLSLFSFNGEAQKSSKSNLAKMPSKDSLDPGLFSTFKFRSLGPALTSGRIADIAVNPVNSSEYYVAAASGGVWKTTNRGINFDPIFDGQGSYSIACLSIDPKNPNVIWVGTGENNNQRSVSYGDGVYKSEDGGKSWKNMGLKMSEHIGRIAIDPSDPDIVFVAAYGPVWSSGGERGIYKTTDGGKTWKQVLFVSEHTGFNEVMIDPRNTKIVYAAAHQRQRKVFTYIGGGPESALYKSTDGGQNWAKLNSGLPSGDLGRIGLNYFPGNPDVLYAVIEAQEGNGGVYRSLDRGASWEKRSNYSTSGNYYQKIYCDPKDMDKIFVMNTYLGISKDGGKSFGILGEKNKHIDNHAIWIDPDNTQHYLVGCDGGLYETYDGGQNWDFKPNLPVTQFYKVATDNSFPFYQIHGGTQDNFSIGGPSRTLSANGIMSSDWYFTSIGDGFETQVDPTNPEIIYAQSQYGGLVRFDKKSGEMLDIKPIEGENEQAYRWNWDAPLLLSAFDSKRLYFGANKLFRSDDRGNSWKAISSDLSRQLDRNKFKVMGKVWSVDAIAKNGSTDIYGNLTSIAESRLDENILWVGTDDGLIHQTTDGGKTWNAIDNIPGVPERSYVHQIIASQYDKNSAYVAFNHHRYGDFHPYLYKTTDGGKTWKAIQSNLPERGSVYCVAEDHVNKDLLFAGTEFGVFCSVDGGAKWFQLKSGLPTIAVRDLEIQKRENDLVLATFGRGFYVLDDYSPLRQLNNSVLDQAAYIFPVKDSWMYLESLPLGVRGKGFQGERFFTSPNPKPAAVFTYYLKEDLKTLREKRQELEKEKLKKGEDFYYPSLDSLRIEDEQEKPHLLLTISDQNGQVVRRIKTTAKKGINRINWDFRVSAFAPIDFNSFDESFVFSSKESGYMALPGTYKLSLSKYEDGNYKDLGVSANFVVKSLNTSSLPEADKLAINQFSRKLGELRRASAAADAYRAELETKLNYFKQAVIETPGLSTDISTSIKSLDMRLNKVNIQFNGDASRSKREFETLPSINGRIGGMVYGLWSTSSAPTQSYFNSYQLASKQFASVLDELKLIDQEVRKLENELEKKKTPYTPGRLPDWKQD